VLTVQATGRQVDAYSWTAARITNGIPIPETGTAAAVAVAEWENRRACSELSPWLRRAWWTAVLDTASHLRRSDRGTASPLCA